MNTLKAALLSMPLLFLPDVAVAGDGIIEKNQSISYVLLEVYAPELEAYVAGGGEFQDVLDAFCQVQETFGLEDCDLVLPGFRVRVPPFAVLVGQDGPAGAIDNLPPVLNHAAESLVVQFAELTGEPITQETRDWATGVVVLFSGMGFGHEAIANRVAELDATDVDALRTEILRPLPVPWVEFTPDGQLVFKDHL